MKRPNQAILFNLGYTFRQAQQVIENWKPHSTPEADTLFPFIQRMNRAKIWKHADPRTATAAQLQILADAQQQIKANLKKAR